MKDKLPISVTFITRNEAFRIEAAIQSVLTFAQEVIVVDSESIDDTVTRARAMGAKVWVRPFRGFGQQKNYAHSLASSEWVLNLDADERVSPELQVELREFLASAAAQAVSGAFLPRKTWYLNRWIMHGGWYPNYLLRLCRRVGAGWTEPALHESLQVQGKIAYFRNPLEHFSFPSQKSHILKNVEYADHAKKSLLGKGRKCRALDLTFRPLWKFFDSYVIKRGFMDGVAGFFIAIHSAYATFLRYAYLYEETIQDPHSRQ